MSKTDTSNEHNHVKALIAAIRLVFPTIPRPHVEAVPYSTYPEAVEVAEAFEPYTWDSVPRDSLFYHRGDLIWMTPHGVRYYLPAYLVFMLEDYELTDTMPDDVLSVLDLMMKKANDKASGFLDGLTRPQKEVLLDFLDWIGKRDSRLAKNARGLGTRLMSVD